MSLEYCSYKGCHHKGIDDLLVFQGKWYCLPHYRRMKAGQRGGVLLHSGTCQEVANFQNMILFGTRWQELGTKMTKPIFPGQEAFPSATFHVTYLVWRENTPILSPIKLKFTFDARNDYAEVRTTDKGIKQLNATAPEVQTRMLSEVKNHKTTAITETVKS